ncbi:MAG TPA: endonuclease/exonuclease/phosphatase family protein [Verrucomicrobiota bacterium]|nr:endonuclease/exonuclease/phosphatase family protein [Verrucomicrobiota bacterium]
MNSLPRVSGRTFSVLAIFLTLGVASAETFRVATYNVENFLDQPTQTRREAKSETAKAKVRESILAAKPDVIAFQEMGTVSALLELRDSLKAAGLDYPHYEHVTGWDTNIFVAVLSKFPFADRRSHTNENFLLSGRRFSVSRGFAEVDIRVNDNYTFTLFNAHLKSKRAVPGADEAELRLEEAKLLREKINARLEANPNANIIVTGDLNDTYNTASTKAVVGTGKFKLVDTRPAERNGDNQPNANPRYNPRNVTWTHFYGVEDSYSRIDYILVSPAMAREWVSNETYIVAVPNWGVGSDHRPLVATFEAANK